jgi:hypothetical protein
MGHPVELWAGLQGSGKSYYLACVWLPRFLAQAQGHVYTSLAVNPDRMSEYVAKIAGISAESVLARIHLLPADELEKWAQGESGPWEYFADIDLSGAQILLDEAHNIIPSSGLSRDAGRQWLKWVSLCRQRGMSLHLISQDERSILKWVLSRVHVRREIVSYSCERDPLFKIPYGDWYMLRSSLWNDEGVVTRRSFVVEYQQIGHRWIPTEGGDEFRFDYDLFPLYNSYAFAGREASGDEPRMARWQAIRWFLGRWWWHMLNRPHIRATIVVMTLVSTAGVDWAMKYAMAAVSEAAAAATRSGVEGEAKLAAGIAREPLTVPKMTPSGGMLREPLPVYPGGVVLDVESLLAARQYLRSQVVTKAKAVARGGGVEGVGAAGAWFGAPVAAFVPVGDVVAGGQWDGWKLQGVRDGKAVLVRGGELRLVAVRGLPVRQGADSAGSSSELGADRGAGE